MAERNWIHLTWSEKTWSERGQTVIANIAAGIVGIAMLLGTLYVLGTIMDVQSERSSERDRCLKSATNGYDIERCQ